MFEFRLSKFFVQCDFNVCLIGQSIHHLHKFSFPDIVISFLFQKRLVARVMLHCIYNRPGAPQTQTHPGPLHTVQGLTASLLKIVYALVNISQQETAIGLVQIV